LARLRARLAVLQLRIRRLYLDRQFYQVEVLQALEADHISYLIPLVLHSSTAKALQAARHSGYVSYSVCSATSAISVTVAVVGRNRKGRRGKRGRRYELFVVGGPRPDLYQLAQLYRRRFGIECMQSGKGFFKTFVITG
jgi:putative transposase